MRLFLICIRTNIVIIYVYSIPGTPNPGVHTRDFYGVDSGVNYQRKTIHLFVNGCYASPSPHDSVSPGVRKFIILILVTFCVNISCFAICKFYPRKVIFKCREFTVFRNFIYFKVSV
jgi:hypothetical protein